MNIFFTVNKAEVLRDVALVTGYQGFKAVGDDEAAERVATTEVNSDILDSFVVGALTRLHERIKSMVVAVPQMQQGDIVHFSLEMPSNFDVTQRGSIEIAAKAYVVRYTVAKWYAVTNKGDAEMAMAEAGGLLDELLRMLYHRKKPVRRQVEL